MTFIIIMMLGIFGAALIAGGIVIYRGSTNTYMRALAAAAIAAGIAMWAFILFITPTSRVVS
jgi:hypothetical protein